MKSKAISAPWPLRVTWEELFTLLICLSLDLMDYALPVLMIPLYGDFLDFAGFAFCVIYFSWIGGVALLELIPGLDVVPFFTLTWLLWYGIRRRSIRQKMETELEKWR